MITEPALYRLMVWLSPAFPVGAFSYSHGLEWLVEQGAVRDEAALRAWLTDLLRHGSLWNDAILFAETYRAASGSAADSAQPSILNGIAALAAALSPSAERRLEAAQQGEAFRRMLREVWPSPTLESLEGPVVYAVAVAIAAADHGIPLAPALTAYLHAAAANLVSAGVRLIPLGQTAGQRVTAALEAPIARAAEAAQAASLEEIGGALILTDMASMWHETQYTRLFRS